MEHQAHPTLSHRPRVGGLPGGQHWDGGSGARGKPSAAQRMRTRCRGHIQVWLSEPCGPWGVLCPKGGDAICHHTGRCDSRCMMMCLTATPWPSGFFYFLSHSRSHFDWMVCPGSGIGCNFVWAFLLFFIKETLARWDAFTLSFLAFSVCLLSPFRVSQGSLHSHVV